LFNVICLALKNTSNIFNAIHDRNSLQQAQITGLTETLFDESTVQTNDQQQSFRPLVNSTVDYFLVDRVPETVQNLFQMVDVFELLDTPAAEEHTN